MRPRNDAVWMICETERHHPARDLLRQHRGFSGRGYLYATTMPGHSHSGELPTTSALMENTAAELNGHVDALSAVIGERRIGEGDSLARARDYLVSELDKSTAAGNGVLNLERLDSNGSNAENVVFELPGQTPDIVLIGAHYDSAPGAPGANDNASGVAVGLYLARTLNGERYRKTVRFVFFANEEPPYFQNPGMGALWHARGCAERREHVFAMLALESLGYYSDEPESQRYPWPVGLFYPDRGTFVGFVGNLGSRWLVREAIGLFRGSAAFPSEGAVLPGWVPGVGWSDHWAFWQFDLCGHHGHGHGRVSRSKLPSEQRCVVQPELRPYGTRDARTAECDC